MDESFTYKYHKEAIDNKKARKNSDGSVTTVKVKGISYNGRVYNLPSYDYKTGKDMDDRQMLKKFKKNIDAGEVDSYDEKFDGELSQHPANIAAKLEHFSIEEDNERAMKSIGYGK